MQESDATWDNARFVTSVLVPNVPEQALCVAGETCVPEMRLAHLRTLPRLKVGTMGWPAALFFGAAIAESNTVLRLSTGATKSLGPLRENKEISSPGPNLRHADLCAMVGALMLNPHARLSSGPHDVCVKWASCSSRHRQRMESLFCQLHFFPNSSPRR